MPIDPEPPVPSPPSQESTWGWDDQPPAGYVPLAPDETQPHVSLPSDRVPGPVADGDHPGPASSTASTLNRRKFVIGAGVVGAAGLVGGALVERPWRRFTSSPRQASSVAVGPSGGSKSGSGTLVLVTLYGGNDGLNTVVPYADPAYQAGRPNLGYQANQVIPLGDGLALNAQLKGLKALWDAKQLAIVRGVGYPNPSLSHFQSMDIWQTASPEGNGSGWLGRWLDATGTDPMRAISVGSTLPPALRGDKTAATAITSTTIALPGRPAFQGAFVSLEHPGPDRRGLAAQVGSTGADLLAVQQKLGLLTNHGPAPASGGSATTPATAPQPGAGGFGDQLQMVASLIRAGAPTRVYQVSLASFDTHADEKANQERLLGELDQGVSGFFATLKGTPQAAGVVLMTFSEFGRRVAENASGGTDHGTAAPLFVAGDGVKGGQFYGEQPSLTDLDDGDIKFNVDFRSVYATMLGDVVGVDPKEFLGASFPTLKVV